ncbi:hypothetical protein FZZ93_01250 [Halomonas eurihalina]|uniref:Uncharacterized protein n=1 Tax=Halomonas eurihalina TaxID=42566 RepID=A0A5D9DDY0_HALER|nr:hypothetical protein [Halomonas eurihalina]MDR5858178.1 hypothetical protein [Halomonas eurihalina]TZG41320.1 hypothetical protein FZZ93_01250 [Halomonas eurihalina]
MTSRATHTHRQHGGRYAELNQFDGGSALEGQKLVAYRDLDKDVTSATTLDDWRQHWRSIAADDCTVCLGTGRDSIKGNKGRPCGGCYGLGKVKRDSETPQDMWELAEVAIGVIQRQHQELGRLRELVALPEVQEIIKAKRDELPDWVQREQHWRGSGGLGHGGRRYTGD